MVCVTPIDLGISTDNLRQLHIHLVDKQLSDCLAITVDRDSSKPEGSSDNHLVKVIPGSPRENRISQFFTQFRGIDAGQPNPLHIDCSAGITVVAVADGHGLRSCIRSGLHLSLSKPFPLLEVLPSKAMRDSTDAKNASAGGERDHAIGGTKLGRHST